MLSVTENERGGRLEDWPDIAAGLADELEIFRPVTEAAPPPEFRETGQKVPRQSHRYSGRTAMLANKTVHEPKPPDDPDSPLSFSMEGFGGRPPAALIPQILVSGLELCPGAQQVPVRGRRTASRRRPGQGLIGPAQMVPSH